MAALCRRGPAPMMHVLLTIALLLVPSTSRAQTTPIRETNINSGAPSTWCPGGAWSNDAIAGGLMKLSHVARGSSSGDDSMRSVGIRVAAPGGQDDWGCRWPVESGTIAQGSERVMRFRLKINPPVRWISNYNGEDRRSTVPEKIAEIGTGCDSREHRTRMIVHLRADPAGVRQRPSIRFTQGTGGTGTRVVAAWRELPIGRWVDLQFVAVSGSTPTSEDGITKGYVDNNNEGSPTFRETGMVIDTWGWTASTCKGTIGVGDHSYNSLSDSSSNNNADFEIADFEYDDDFDPKWDIAAAQPPGRGAGSPVMSILALLGLAGWQRRASRTQRESRVQLY